VCIIRTQQCISPEVIVKGFKKCYIYNVVDGTDDSMLWNLSAEDGNVRSVRKMKALTVKMETMTMAGISR
jgi:hypothetical protein